MNHVWVYNAASMDDDRTLCGIRFRGRTEARRNNHVYEIYSEDIPMSLVISCAMCRRKLTLAKLSVMEL